MRATLDDEFLVYLNGIGQMLQVETAISSCSTHRSGKAHTSASDRTNVLDSSFHWRLRVTLRCQEGRWTKPLDHQIPGGPGLPPLQFTVD